MKTQKIVFFSLIIFCFTLTTQAQRGVRIGYIDMEYILESVPEYTEASTQLEGRVERWRQDIERMSKEIDQMKLNLSNERVLLTTELVEEREEEIKLKEDEMLKYQQDRFGPNGDLVIQRKQLVQPIQDQVFNIVQEIAENRKYDFIFDKSADIVMLFAAERNDISDQVLRSINRAAKREEATTRNEKREIEARDNLSLEEDKAITEREQEIEARQEEREQRVEQRKTEREQLMAERQRVRDSIKAARQTEIEERRQRLLEERQRRIDSIKAVREAKQREREEGNPEGEDDGENNGNN